MHPSGTCVYQAVPPHTAQAVQEKAERDGRLKEQAEKSRLRREVQEGAAAAEAARCETDAAEQARPREPTPEAAARCTQPATLCVQARAGEAEVKAREQARAAAVAQSRLLGGGADAPGSPSLSAATDESLSLGQTDSDASTGW